jgi:hypothetical protein
LINPPKTLHSIAQKGKSFCKEWLWFYFLFPLWNEEMTRAGFVANFGESSWSNNLMQLPDYETQWLTAIIPILEKPEARLWRNKHKKGDNEREENNFFTDLIHQMIFEKT